jgi:hypothetical protein
MHECYSIRRALFGVLALGFIVMLAAVPATGQCPPPPTTSPLGEGEIGLFFDPLGTTTCTDLVPAIPATMYTVARVPAGGVARFSIPEILPVSVPSGLIILSGSLGMPPPGYQTLIVLDGCDEAERIDPMTCPVSQGDLLVIGVHEVIAFTPLTGTACFQTACQTIAGIMPRDPGYNRCDNGAAGTFVGGAEMCVGFGQSPVPVEASTWGRIKTLYDAP